MEVNKGFKNNSLRDMVSFILWIGIFICHEYMNKETVFKFLTFSVFAKFMYTMNSYAELNRKAVVAVCDATTVE